MSKKFLIFFIIAISTVSSIYCQPGKSYFPFISFFDHYINARMGVEPWGRRDTLSVYGRVNSVYDLMKAAGITHTVTLLDNYTSNPNNNPGIKIFDRHIEWSSISFLPLNGSHKPGEYILSQGQEENNYSFEIGNNSSITPGSLTKANNFGFGTDGGFQSSVWFMNINSQMIPSFIGDSISGVTIDDEDNDATGIRVRRATPRVSGGGYYMVYGIVNRMMFTRDRQHYMKIKAKLDPGSLPDTTHIFTVKVKIKPYVTTTTSKTAGKQNANPLDTLSIPDDSPPEVVFEMPVLKSAFVSPGSYEWIEITHPYFRRDSTFNEVGKEIEIGFFFENNIAVNVDKLVIQDQDYREYVSNPVLRNDIKSAINSNVNLYASNPLFESNYYDEPYMLTAKVRRDYQNILREGPGGSRMDLNGATGGYWKWHLAFDIDKVTNNSFYRHSLLYDWYPLKRNTPRGFGNPGNQVVLQKAFDEMIVYRGEPVLKGSDDSLDQMQHMGYIPALDASQNFTADDLSDDIPLFHTIQVAASRIIERNAGSYTYIANDHKLRAPSREEIHTMGNLAIAYGAKGLMFYMVPTRIPNISTADGSRVEATYGLFDNPGNLYNDDENAQVCRSRGDLEQVGNYRYFAVKEFTGKIKGIEKFILRSHWVNGFTGETNTHRIPGNIQWIDSIKSENSITGTRDTKAWVEAGLFKYTTVSTQGAVSIIPDTILIYLVNRFCDETDTVSNTTVKRDITVSLKPLNLPYSNYSVINLSDTTNPVIASLSDGMIDPLRKFTVSLHGGEGCMLMITPTIYTGGEFREDETIHKNEVIKKTLHMKNHKLTVANGVSLEFQNSSKLIVEDGQLVIGDSVNTNIVLDFKEKNWSAGNGVFSYRSPVRIKNATIKNASCGLYSHISPGDIIDGLKTENTHTGISLYYSYNYGADNTVIRNSHFTNSQLWGITMVGSKPVLHDNTFHNSNQSGIGVRALSGSKPQLLDTLLGDGNNKFENLGTSISSLNSEVLLGRVEEYGFFGRNCFLGDLTSLELKSEDYGETVEIDAYGNDWESESPDKFRITIEGNYYVHTAGYNNYCSQEQNKMAKNNGGNTNKTNSIESDSIKTIFIQIQNLINTGELRLARELIDRLVSGETSTSIKKKAVRLLPRTYEASELQDLISGLLRIRQIGNLFKVTTMLLMNIDTENMAAYKQEILNAGNNKMNGAGDNSEQVMIIYNSLLEEKYKSSGLIDTAGKVTPMLTYLNSNFPTSEYTRSANLLFSDIPNNSPMNGVLSKQQPSDSKPESVIYEYKLFNNYPNPFNPETIVEYSVKEKSNVTLSIYDILGRKIHEVEEPGINSGRYEMRWQGTNKYGEKVSSGVYILEMRAKSLESTTEYRSSIKLLLTK